MIFTEKMLLSYEAPLSDTEEQKCKNAINMVRDALKGLGYADGVEGLKNSYSDDTYAYTINMRNAVKNRDVKLLLQGSYANKTNVRQESDVDIAVIEENTFITLYPVGADDSTYRFVAKEKSNTWSINPFKDEVEEALKKKFGNDVDRQNKSIKIHGNTYRVNTDTVPSMRHRDYKTVMSFDSSNYIGGIHILADDGTVVVNYPEQHIINGRKKNVETNYYYKKMVKVIKKIRYIMKDNGMNEAKEVSSFALKSLLWNIPNEVFINNSPISSCLYV